MDTAQLINTLKVEGTRLAGDAKALSLDATVPSCPGWTVRDLVRHIGGVHRWAVEHLRLQSRVEIVVPDFLDLFGTWPDDEYLIVWYRAELALLLETLDRADPAAALFTLITTDAPLAFWARRQAIEAAIHRVDLEQTAGAITPVMLGLALEGIEELIGSFLPGSHFPLRHTPPRTMLIAPDRWLIVIGPDGVATSRVEIAADCTVRGPASDLFLALWNRPGIDALDIAGDASLMDRFCSAVQIRRD